MIISPAIIQELIKSGLETPADLISFKRRIAKKYKIPCPNNIHLLKAYHKFLKNTKHKASQKIKNLLKTRPIRSLSGIVNISVLSKPYKCPGKCIFCPTEKNIPKSYLSGEPAVERAKKLNYNPYQQVKKRIQMLEQEGHPTDKIELRIIGGTWSYYPRAYQIWFISECFRACNLKISNVKCLPDKQAGQMSKIQFGTQNLKNIQKINETAKHRIIGLSVETRPDFISFTEIKRLRELGATTVELGVQSIYNDVLKLNQRGHNKKKTIQATKLLKDAGFKVCYQIMPNLLGSTLKRDLTMFQELFTNPDFQPDYLKIYPCALLKATPLYQKWQNNQYLPYKKEQLLNLIKSIKKIIPYYVRIQRITRDIPAASIVAGPAKISNMRQLIADKMESEKWSCRCIRCREVRNRYDSKEKLYFFRQDYLASDGKEIFLSFEDRDRKKLYSLLRFRIHSYLYQKRNKTPNQKYNLNFKKSHFLPILNQAVLIREIHTYGQQLSLNDNSAIRLSPQHKGLGKNLIKKAETIAQEEFSLNKIAVISGVGARGYYRKLGFKLKETYMVKKLNEKKLVLYSKNSSNAFRRLRRRGASPENRDSAAPMTISSFSLAANSKSINFFTR